MNEQIKQLAKQCWDGRHQGQLHFDTEKFAEMIVVKCANIVWDEAEKTMNKEVNEVGYKLLDSFGIKR